MNIIISPFTVTNNEYINITKKNLINIGYEISPMHFKLIFKRGNNIFIGNWIEDSISGKGIKLLKGFALALIKICYAKLAAKKFIWIRHNFKPHSGNRDNRLYEIIIKLLILVSDAKCSHAEYMLGYEYIPHPLYDIKCGDKLLSTIRDVEFIYFGIISRYKGLIELLSEWPEDRKLVLYGKCDDVILAKQLKKLIISRKLQVKYKFEFISEEELQKIFSQAKYIILPHSLDTMIVSGAFFHAISYGLNILVNNNKFGVEIAQRHSFCTVFENGNLNKIFPLLKYVHPDDVISEARRFYGPQIVQKKWFDLLNKLINLN
jgi:hypothetical protein